MNRRDLIGLFLMAGCGLSAAQSDPGKDVIGMISVGINRNTAPRPWFCFR